MVTLLGFFFILINVLFLQIFMPDLVGPVSSSPANSPLLEADELIECSGAFMVVL